MMQYSVHLKRFPAVFVTRPDIAGIMGAFGAALIARERYEGKQTTMLSLDDIIALQYDTSMTRCRGCNNNCVMTVNKFEGGRNFISGNRCERGLGKDRVKKDVPNLYEYKYNRMLAMSRLQPTRRSEVLSVYREF